MPKHTGLALDFFRGYAKVLYALKTDYATTDTHKQNSNVIPNPNCWGAAMESVCHRSPEAARQHRRIEVAGIAAWLAVAAAVGARLCLLAGDAAWVVAMAAVFGLLVTDFLSGVVHWAADNYGSEHTPVLGQNLIVPFREHHVDQTSITRHDFVETNGNNCLGALPILLAAFNIPIDHEAEWPLFSAALLFFVALWGFATNQIHKWAHSNAVPAAVALLQRLRIILPSQHHAVHHSAPHTENYCITNGWMNEPLARIRFFPTLERLIARIAGVTPRAD